MRNGVRNSLVGGALLILAVSIVFVILSQIGPKSTYTISTVSAVCETNGLDEITIEPNADTITIIAPMTTPTPCFNVAGSVKFFNRNINIELLTLPKQGACIQCIGEVTGKVVIQSLAKGTYNLEVKTPDKTAAKSVTIE